MGTRNARKGNVAAAVEHLSRSSPCPSVCLRQENPYRLMILWDIVQTYNLWQLALI